MAVSSSKSALSVGQRLWNSLSAWAVRNAGYQKYGLRREDLYMEEDPAVAEAIRRLPQEEQDLRLWRLKRALDLSMKKSILPKEQWTADEECASCRGTCGKIPHSED
ncbi:Cytochrome b-c1 complex subunit 7 [Geodia barretti]|uniref:Cytochrome b-c1 complex subunit 7 n=1 Tax=Geodia barretti TaxID=519541 RepID=A0AA35X4P7_GEOBA|nr:Cytochrome b-c1 complex subunit 7 [Geodia barretti]